MFENLLESKVKRRRSWGQGALSLVLHGAVIFAAVKATQGVAEARRDTTIDTTMVFMKTREPSPPVAAPAAPKSEATTSSANPPPKGFKTVLPPTEIPTEIPQIDFNEKPFDPKDYTGVGVEGGSGVGVPGGTGPLDAPGGGGGVGGGVYAAGDLDDPVQVIDIQPPKYPPALQSMGLPGRVELQYIVDTTGRAEPSSFKVLSQTNVAFVNPAKEAILKGVFKPAKFRGRPVRQLVQQAISFKVGQ